MPRVQSPRTLHINVAGGLHGTSKAHIPLGCGLKRSCLRRQFRRDWEDR